MTWRLYQQHTEPVSTDAGTEVITVSKWFKSFTDPTRRSGIAVALIASGAVISPWALTQAEAVTESRWHQPYSEPVRVKKLAAAQQQSLAWTPITIAAPGSDDVRFNQANWTLLSRKTTLYQSIAEPVTVARTDVTADSWFSPLSQPQTARKLPASEQQFVAYVKSDESKYSWFTPFSVPTSRVRPTPRHEASLVVKQPEPLTPWLQPLASPLNIKKYRQDTNTGFIYAPATEIITTDKWFEPLSEPIRRKAKPPDSASDLISVAAATPGDDDVQFVQYNWTQLFKKTTLYQSITDPTYTISGEVITVDKWFRPLSEPNRLKPFTGQQQAAFAPVSTPSEVITLDKWFEPLATPTLAKSRQYGQFQPVFARPEPSFAWFVKLDEPTRRKPPASIGEISLVVSQAEPPTPWYQPLSEPVRLKRFNTGLQQQPVLAYAQPQPLTVWFAPLSEPVRVKLRVAWQQDLALVKADPFPEETNYAKWGYPLSEPVRLKSGLLASLQVSYTAPVFATPEIVTVDKWFADFSLPKRDKPRPTHFDTFSRPPEIVQISYGWYQPLDIPKRVRPWLYSVSPQGFYFLGIDNPVPSMASWSYGFSSPVRLRTSLMAASQQSSVMPVIPIPNPPGPTGQYTVSGLYVIDQFTDNTVVYDYDGRVSHRTN